VLQPRDHFFHEEAAKLIVRLCENFLTGAGGA